MYRRSLLPLLLLAVAPTARAADHDLAFGVGVVHQQLREELIRPLRWDGPGGALEVVWGVRGAHHRIETEFRLPLSVVHNRYDHDGAALGLRLASGITWDALPLAQGVVSFGGALKGEEALFYSWDWDEEHLFWLTSWEIGPLAAWERPLAASQSLRLSLFVPVAALVSRPPIERFEKIDDLMNPGFYFSKPHSNLSLTSLHEHQAVQATATWAWSFSPSWELVIGLEWAYTRHTEPVPVERIALTLLPLVRHAL